MTILSKFHLSVEYQCDFRCDFWSRTCDDNCFLMLHCLFGDSLLQIKPASPDSDILSYVKVILSTSRHLISADIPKGPSETETKQRSYWGGRSKKDVLLWLVSR